jgi:hypothetical protein
MKAIALVFLAGAAALAADPVYDRPSGELEYQVLATSKTSTLEKELNAAGQSGFRLIDMKGGETMGGEEVVAIVERPAGDDPVPRYEYRVLATNKTSTMQKELAEAGEQGYAYFSQAVSKTAFGGQEILVVVGRELDAPRRRFAYRLLATSRTKTMHRELNGTQDGFKLVGLTVDETAFAGAELVAILMREE